MPAVLARALARPPRSRPSGGLHLLAQRGPGPTTAFGTVATRASAIARRMICALWRRRLVLGTHLVVVLQNLRGLSGTAVEQWRRWLLSRKRIAMTLWRKFSVVTCTLSLLVTGGVEVATGAAGTPPGGWSRCLSRRPEWHGFGRCDRSHRRLRQSLGDLQGREAAPGVLRTWPRAQERGPRSRHSTSLRWWATSRATQGHGPMTSPQPANGQRCERHAMEATWLQYVHLKTAVCICPVT